MTQVQHKRIRAVCVVLINALCILIVAGLFWINTRTYSERLTEQNLNDIAHLNESTVRIATAYFDRLDSQIGAAAAYIGSAALDKDGTAAYLATVSADAQTFYQLVGADRTGIQVTKDQDGNFKTVNYSASSYGKLWSIFAKANTEDDVIHLMPEFTNSVTGYGKGLKVFGVYRYLSIPDKDGNTEVYTLMLLTKKNEFAVLVEPIGEYHDLGVALTNRQGDYIINSDAFSSGNFYDFLKDYNTELTLDDINDIEDRMLQTPVGNIFDLKGMYSDDVSVYSYRYIPERDWYAITYVPESSFVRLKDSSTYAVRAVIVAILLLVTDVTYLIGLNRRLRRSARQAAIADSAKSDFLSRMSHDIRTPLNGIIGMTHLAQEETNPRQIKEYLDNIDLSGEFLLGLVNDILDVSKIAKEKMELHPEPYTYTEFRKYIVAVFEPLCSAKSILFTMTDDQNFPPVMLDKLRFNQIFFNLLSNAVKYTASGGHIALTFDMKISEKRRAALTVRVQDDGIGMSEEFQTHMFEAFSQENRNTEPLGRGGTGLGLSIVYGFVRLMNGTIDVSSRLGAGSCFTVRMETDITRDGVTTADDEERYPEGFLKGKRLLLVEDNAINVMVARKLLEKMGAAVDAAANGEAGVDAFVQSPPGTYAAILMDINMPVMDGYTATQKIRLLDRPDAPGIVIIAMTANAYDEDAVRSIEAGMNAHIAKPINTNALYGTLYRLIFTDKKSR